MAVPHASSGTPVDVQPFGTLLAGARTTALCKARDLEVIRLVLPAGKALREHTVPGDITIQCIEGRIDVTAGGASHVLGAGQLVFLAGGTPHGVTALADASALVTIALRPSDAGPAA